MKKSTNSKVTNKETLPVKIYLPDGQKFDAIIAQNATANHVLKEVAKRLTLNYSQWGLTLLLSNGDINLEGKEIIGELVEKSGDKVVRILVYPKVTAG